MYVRSLLVLALIAVLAAGCRSQSTPTTTVALKPPDASSPAAGICVDAPSGELVTIRAMADVPDPRCTRARRDQKLEVVNATAVVVTVSLADLQATLQPGERVVLDRPLGQFLAPGVHHVALSTPGNAALWLQ